MRHLQQVVFTEDWIEQFVVDANRYLEKEATKPRTDTRPIEVEIKKVRAARDQLAKVLELEGDHDLGSLVARVRSHERRLRELNEHLRETKSRNYVSLPIEQSDVERILQDLRGLLNEDVAAPIIQTLTGPIVVHQKYEPGKKKPVWYAEFTVNMVPALVMLAAKKVSK